MLTLHVHIYTHSKNWKEQTSNSFVGSSWWWRCCCCNFCLPRILKYYEARRMDHRRCEQLCKQDKFYDSASRTNFVYFSKRQWNIRAMWFVMRISRLTPSDSQCERARTREREREIRTMRRCKQNHKVKKVKGDNCRRCIITAFNRLINKY